MFEKGTKRKAKKGLTVEKGLKKERNRRAQANIIFPESGGKYVSTSWRRRLVKRGQLGGKGEKKNMRDYLFTKKKERGGRG